MLVTIETLASLSLWVTVGLIVWYVEPTAIKDIGIHNSYLILIVPVILAFFYTINLLINKTWLGLTIAIGLGLVLYLLLVF